ncbi:MAG: FAD-dependent oxidoreductase [Eubacteriales bacterium]|nr:FAD-dependent oxidoreductase [Eubacteriales bacterium]
MIRINQIKLPIFEVEGHSEEELVLEKVVKLLKIKKDGIRKLRLIRRSIDAREKNNIYFVYTVDVRLHDSIVGPAKATEEAFVKKFKNNNISVVESIPLSISENEILKNSDIRPVIIGCGPCGLFAAHSLIKMGLKPIVIEQGSKVDERTEIVERFFETGNLSESCNVQFGEGGAGTFSDGKLNTSIKGQQSYIRYVLEQFVKYGADKDILIDQKPHIGTDVLVDVIRAMRNDMIANGAEFYFDTKLTDFEIEDGRLKGIWVKNLKKKEDAHFLKTEKLILAIGHSARDTFSLLKEKNFNMEKKSFAMGVRVQHPQEVIDRALYGEERLSDKERLLGPASYKLTHKLKDGRSIYSFCMCPGGYVVNSSSEEKKLCINGMSYNDRASGVANSALIVNINAEDFPSEDVLSGIELQRSIEEAAYSLCDGIIPYESYKEFKEGCEYPLGECFYTPKFKGYAAAADVRHILPSFMQEAIIEGIEAFNRQIKGFNMDEALIAGVEARTSSPVRILRDKTGMSNIYGVFPAGEGAGYAGGITSAAIDGIKSAMLLCNELLDN